MWHPRVADWTVRDSQAPNYFKTTLESISRDDKANLVSSNIHLTGVAPDQSNDLRFIIARVRGLRRKAPSHLLLSITPQASRLTQRTACGRMCTPGALR